MGCLLLKSVTHYIYFYMLSYIFTVVKPDYYTYVFIKSDKPVTGVSITEPGSVDEELVDLDTNDQQLLPYKSVEHLLNNSSIHLI